MQKSLLETNWLQNWPSNRINAILYHSFSRVLVLHQWSEGFFESLVARGKMKKGNPISTLLALPYTGRRCIMLKPQWCIYD